MEDTLIRLHSEDEEAIFDCDFNDEIIINPKAQISLASVSMNRLDKTLIIDANNDEVLFQITAGRQLRYLIPHGKFNKNSAPAKFAEMTDSMNRELRMVNPADPNTNLPKETGTQCKISVDTTGKVNYDLNYSRALDANATRDIFNGTVGTQISATGNLKSKNAASTGGVDFQTAVFGFSEPFGLGASFARYTIRTLTGAGGGEFSGCIAGLTTNFEALQNGSLRQSDFECLLWSGSNARNYFSLVKGEPTFTDTGVAPNKVDASGDPTNDNDCISFEFMNHAGAGNLGNIQSLQIKRYNQQADTVQILRQDIELPVRDPDTLQDIKYYFVITFQGGEASCIVQTVKMTPNPFENPAIVAARNAEQELEAAENNLAVSPPTTRAQNTIYNVILPPSVATFFGYLTSTLNPDLVSSPSGAFVSTLQFQNFVTSDNYLVQMLNIPIQSYDSFKKGRENIIASIPFSETHLDDDSGLIQYEPNERLYCNIGNASKMSLRNIKCRIVANDYTTLDMIGLASLTLIIRNRIE